MSESSLPSPPTTNEHTSIDIKEQSFSTMFMGTDLSEKKDLRFLHPFVELKMLG